MKDLVFYNLFKASLLFYSWNQLKSEAFFGSYLSFNSFSPFSSFWFKKTAYLIREGKFVYKMRSKLSFFKYKNKKTLINALNQLVIELSFIYVIKHIKKNSVSFGLTKCLRYFRGKILLNFM